MKSLPEHVIAGVA